MPLDRLAYVALVSRDVDGVARFFQRTLGLARTEMGVGDTSREVPLLAVGQSAIALFAPGDPFLEGEERTGVHHIAFATDDPSVEAARIGREGFRASPAPSGLQNRKRFALDATATAGVRAFLTEPIERKDSPAGTVERIDHLGIASADNAAAVEIFSRRLGLVLESQQTDMEVEIAVESFTSDKYGAVYHTRPARPVGGLRVAFITAGDCELEFLQNFNPAQGAFVDHASAGTTRQDQGAITRYIASRGAGLHHVAFKVSDINAALAATREAGFPTIDLVGRPGSRRALIGFVQPKVLGGVLIHFVQRDEASVPSS